MKNGNQTRRIRYLRQAKKLVHDIEARLLYLYYQDYSLEELCDYFAELTALPKPNPRTVSLWIHQLKKLLPAAKIRKLEDSARREKTKVLARALDKLLQTDDNSSPID